MTETKKLKKEDMIKRKVKDYLKSLDPLQKMVDDKFMFSYDELMTSVEIATQEAKKDCEKMINKLRKFKFVEYQNIPLESKDGVWINLKELKEEGGLHNDKTFKKV